MTWGADPDPRQMSQRELDEYLDQLVAEGAEVTPQPRGHG